VAKRKIRKFDPSIRIATCRIAGQKGGTVTAGRYTEEFRQQRSSTAGQACLARYGPDFYRHIRQIGIEKQKQQKVASAS
jgi:hypothetical protein